MFIAITRFFCWYGILPVMRTPFTLSLTLLLFPGITFAQQTIQNLLVNLMGFLNDFFIPFLLAIAFLFFVINVIRFFVIGSTSEEGREKAKNVAIYSVLAFVLIVTFWGIINLLASSIGLEGCSQPQSDYVLSHFVGPMQPECPE